MRQYPARTEFIQAQTQLLKWDALVQFDPEISEAAAQLRPYGSCWVSKLGSAYFALEEDRKYIPLIEPPPRSAEVCARGPPQLVNSARQNPAEKVGLGRTGGGRGTGIQRSPLFLRNHSRIKWAKRQYDS